VARGRAGGDAETPTELQTPPRHAVARGRAGYFRPKGGRALIRAEGPEALLVIVPAYNEEGAIGEVVHQIHDAVPGVPVLVIDDCSLDNTVAAARRAGAEILGLPHHLGLGGGLQAAYKLAYERGFQYVIRVDGDGQHDPRDIAPILAKLKETGCEMVIGSRVATANGWRTGLLRKAGIRFFRLVLRPILGRPVSDPTSGFVGVNRRALDVFRRSFPLEYPEIEVLVVLQRRRFRFEEVPCHMRPRLAGRSTITARRAFYYMSHVLLGVFVNVLKYERRRRPNPPQERATGG
jgi:glycosyltransferase involved in cell wall biosynthesis